MYDRCQIRTLADPPGTLFNTLVELIVKFASYGLIHCDFNEFNVMIDSDDTPIVIDFPQMVSIDHSNAHRYTVSSAVRVIMLSLL